MIFASRCFARHYSNRCTVNRGVCFVQLVGTETGDTTPSILLHNQYASYIFNCGENLSRSFQAAKTDLSSLQRVFLTQLTARAIGGLPGLCLTFGSSLAQLDIQASTHCQRGQGLQCVQGYRLGAKRNPDRVQIV